MGKIECPNCLCDVEVAKFAGNVVLRNRGRVTYPSPTYGGSCPNCGHTFKWEEIKKALRD